MDEALAIVFAKIFGGGDGSIVTPGEWCGNVNQDTTSFPTQRLDDEPLKPYDYVTVLRGATLPFTIEGLTFENKNDVAVYNGATWELNPSAYQNTKEVPLDNKAIESLSGLANNQKEVNVEVINKIKEINPLLIVAEENQTINGYSVPKLTEENLTDIFNAQMAGKQVVILDATGNYGYTPKQVDTDTDNVYVCFDFCDVMMLTYKTTADGVETTFKEFASNENAYESLEFVGDIDNSYLAYASYVELDYSAAKKYYDTGSLTNFISGCSSIVRDGKLARNYDWKYSNACEFIVRTPAINNRHSVLGVVGQVDGLTKDFVKSGDYDEMYKIVPFALTDGKNDTGLQMTINVVPNDKGNTTDTNPGKEKINALMFVRWALDNCASVEEVQDKLQNEISLYIPQGLRDLGYEVHFLVADETQTKVLEFVNNACVWVENDKITNFFIRDVDFKEDGTVPVIGDSDIDSYGLTTNSEGLERYNILVNGGTVELEALLQNLKFTNTYTLTSNKWYSELCGGSLIITSPMADFESAMTTARSEYASRNRDTGLTYQTNHSLIYDDEKLTIWTQEDFSNQYNFELPKVDVKVDGSSIDKNENKELEIKDDGVTNAKINPSLKSTEIPEDVDDCVDEKLTTEKAVREAIDKARSDIIEIPYKPGVGDYTEEEKQAIYENYTNVEIVIPSELLNSDINAYYYGTKTDTNEITRIFKNAPFYGRVANIQFVFNDDGEMIDLLVDIEQDPFTDDTTIEMTAAEDGGKLRLKNFGIENKHINESLKSTEIPDSVDDCTDDKLTTEKAVFNVVKIAGHSLDATIDTSTYIMTLQLKDKTGAVLSTKTIDLPLESLVLNVEYVNTTEHPKSLKITLQSGTIIYAPLSDIIEGLENTSNKVTTIDSTATNTQYPSALAVKNFLTSSVVTGWSVNATNVLNRDLAGVFRNGDLVFVTIWSQFNDIPKASSRPTLFTNLPKCISDGNFGAVLYGMQSQQTISVIMEAGQTAIKLDTAGHDTTKGWYGGTLMYLTSQ